MKLARLKRLGFDVGYSKQLGGVAIETANENRKLSYRGTVADAYQYLDAMEEGASQVLSFIWALSPSDMAKYIQAYRRQNYTAPTEALIAHC